MVDNLPQVTPISQLWDQKDYQEYRDAVDQGPEQKSEIQKLTDLMYSKVQESREAILKNLIEDPGVVATFGENFVVEFGDVELRTLDDPGLRDLNEYRVDIIQTWRIRRRKDDE